MYSFFHQTFANSLNRAGFLVDLAELGWVCLFQLQCLLQSMGFVFCVFCMCVCRFFFFIYLELRCVTNFNSSKWIFIDLN